MSQLDAFVIGLLLSILTAYLLLKRFLNGEVDVNGGDGMHHSHHSSSHSDFDVNDSSDASDSDGDGDGD